MGGEDLVLQGEFFQIVPCLEGQPNTHEQIPSLMYK